MDIPQRDRISLRCVIKEGHARNALGDLALGVRRRAQATQVTLDISGEHRHPRIAEGFGQTLQCDGFAGAGGAGDQPVTVGQTHGLGNRLAREVCADKELRGIRHFVTHG